MEWNAWSEGNPPSHHVMLPFTRMLSGPLDYTPGTFDILFLNTKYSPLSLIHISRIDAHALVFEGGKNYVVVVEPDQRLQVKEVDVYKQLSKECYIPVSYTHLLLRLKYIFIRSHPGSIHILRSIHISACQQ